MFHVMLSECCSSAFANLSIHHIIYQNLFQIFVLDLPKKWHHISNRDMVLFGLRFFQRSYGGIRWVQFFVQFTDGFVVFTFTVTID